MGYCFNGQRIEQHGGLGGRSVPRDPPSRLAKIAEQATQSRAHGVDLRQGAAAQDVEVARLLWRVSEQQIRQPSTLI